MSQHLTYAFADELCKTAGIGSALGNVFKAGEESGIGKAISGVIENLKKSPAHRKALMHASLLGAATGASGGLMSGGDGRLGNALRGAAGGALGGAVTGVAFPGWFSHTSRRLG